MNDTSNRNSSGRYDALRSAHERIIQEGKDQTMPEPPQSRPPSSQPTSDYERWRKQTMERIDRDRAREEGPPQPSNDPEFEKQFDAKQRMADELFKMEFGEDAERRDVWRNKERKTLMKQLPASEEAKELGDLRRREIRRYQEQQQGPQAGDGAEP
jgi:hypothetical protein